MKVERRLVIQKDEKNFVQNSKLQKQPSYKSFFKLSSECYFRERLIAFDEKGNETFCTKKRWKFLLYIDETDSVALRWVSAARVSAFIRAGRNKYFSGMGATFGKNVSTILVTKQPILHESATYIRVALLGFALKLSLKFGCNVVIVFRCASIT